MPKYFPVFEDIEKHKNMNLCSSRHQWLLKVFPLITPADAHWRTSRVQIRRSQRSRSFRNTRADDVYTSLNACFKRTDSWKPTKALQTAATVQIRNSAQISPAVKEHRNVMFKTLTRATDVQFHAWSFLAFQLKMKQSVQVWGFLQSHLSQVRMCCDAGDNVCVCNTQRYLV